MKVPASRWRSGPRVAVIVGITAVGAACGAALAIVVGATSDARALGTTTTTTQVVSSVADSDLAPAVDYSHDLNIQGAKAFQEYPLYWPSSTADGYSLDRVIRVVRSPSVVERSAGVATWLNMVDFNYGQCVDSPGSEAVCGWPVEIQEFPSCDRNFAQLNDPTIPFVTVDGTTGIDVGRQDGGQIEIYTSSITIAIFAPTKDVALQVAAELMPLNASAVLTPTGDLPPADAGALQGKLGCPGVNVPP